jgi:hypothetical protein
MLPQLPIAGETFTVFRAKLGEHPIVICLLGSEPPEGMENRLIRTAPSLHLAAEKS